MDIENEHVQQPSSASSTTDTSASGSSGSGSSSNNSSNSNLLVNLPMLQTSSVEDADDEAVNEEELSLSNANQQQAQPLAVEQTEQQTNAARENNSLLFLSPLLFNNNITTALSSTASTSSSSSSSTSSSTNTHNLHTFQQEHELQQHLDTEHHHSPPPSSQPNAHLPTTTAQPSGIDEINEQENINQATSSQQPTASGVGQLLLPTSSSSSSSSRTLATVSTTTLPHLAVPHQPSHTNNQSTYSTPNSLHYQYHQHSHHYHTPDGCSNILATNNKQNMFNSNEGNNVAVATTTAAISNATTVDRLKLLYPNVDESETPLPRCWSAHDKCLAIGLSQNNLRVHYKGKYNLESTGKQHNDAASVRTAHPIPAACGLYYFEVKIVSKGKNGYMGIGLTAQQFRMNRLPGWDKQSYGYHGDDGNSFSSSGNGQAYGPTFTTGDIIGCCVNFINNT